MTSNRFYSSAASVAGKVITLSETESHHLTSVLRLHSGDTIRIFDGQGHEFTAQIEIQTKQEVTAKLIDKVEPAAEPKVKLTLAQAVLKGRGFDMVVRDATMLGVTNIQPILSQRSCSPPGNRSNKGTLERWRKIAISSAKQSGRAVVPEVSAPIGFEQMLTEAIGYPRILLVEPNNYSTQNGLTSLNNQPKPSVSTLAIGPEGGWTKSELESANNHSFLCLTLGTRTFRADAAPVAAISVLQSVWGDL
jgi:16S rRNA (uracil1498-N3)-methyltransferase